MTRPDGVRFLAGLVVTSAVVPGLLWAGEPFAEPRRLLGLAVGWMLAVAIIAPSFVLLARALGSDDNQRFLLAFMAGTALRFVVAIAGVLLFATLVDDPPIKTFLLSFFLGYFLLTGLEMALTFGRSPNGEHA